MLTGIWYQKPDEKQEEVSKEFLGNHPQGNLSFSSIPGFLGSAVDRKGNPPHNRCSNGNGFFSVDWILMEAPVPVVLAALPRVGVEWLIDAHGCRADVLADLDEVRSICERILADLDLRVVGQGLWHTFPEPGGVTGLYLLTESHLACHTYPEHGIATFNLYCCRPRLRWPWEEQLREHLGANVVHVRQLERATGSEVES